MTVPGRLSHPIPPTWDAFSETLVLGSFPSVKSRETGYFYGHPQNRFWKVLAGVFEEACPVSVPEKKALLLRHHVAVWDVIASCTIAGSSDSSIRDAVPNDLRFLLEGAPIRRIFCNGQTALRLYRMHIQPTLGLAAEGLPSTSPANAAWNLERLTAAWSVLRKP